MTLDAHVKMYICDSGYFQGEETLVVHAASSLQEFWPADKKNTKHYLMALKTTRTTTTHTPKNKTSTTWDTNRSYMKLCIRLDCLRPHFCSLHCMQLEL